VKPGDASAPTRPALQQPLALFPLRMVLFPDAVLGLRVFEARYLDLVSRCLKSGQPFGVVALREGPEAGPSPQGVQLAQVGTLAWLDEVDADEPGLLRVRALGGQRFRLAAAATQQRDGLWTAPVELLAADTPRQPGPAMLQTVAALAEAIKKLQTAERNPFQPPYRLDDAGWVANRWCELLPVPLAAKQKLMELADPVIRLSIVDGYLRDKKVVLG